MFATSHDPTEKFYHREQSLNTSIHTLFLFIQIHSSIITSAWMSLFYSLLKNRKTDTFLKINYFLKPLKVQIDILKSNHIPSYNTLSYFIFLANGCSFWKSNSLSYFHIRNNWILIQYDRQLVIIAETSPLCSYGYAFSFFT